MLALISLFVISLFGVMLAQKFRPPQPEAVTVKHILWQALKLFVVLVVSLVQFFVTLLVVFFLAFGELSSGLPKC